MDTSHSVIDYLSSRQCAVQWKVFLLSTARELADKLSANELRAFMRRVGARFGDELPLPPCATVDEIQLAMSETWTRLDWGWTEVAEETDHLSIRHYCSPLQAAMGSDAFAWTPAFLEGVYQRWFEQLGAGDMLQVAQAADAEAISRIDFRLAARQSAA